MKFLLIALWMAMVLVAGALPTLSEDFDFANVTAVVTSVENPTVHTLEKRHTITCDKGPHTNGFWVIEGIKELRKRKGRPYAEPYTCKHVYRSHGTEITWCNDDRKKERYLPSYNNIADAIYSVLIECGDTAGFSGECNHPDLWRAYTHHGWGRKEEPGMDAQKHGDDEDDLE
ncbi:hypothetical protein BJX65DRAFT_288643 [Aspergillus insuetus]